MESRTPEPSGGSRIVGFPHSVKAGATWQSYPLSRLAVVRLMRGPPAYSSRLGNEIKKTSRTSAHAQVAQREAKFKSHRTDPSCPHPPPQDPRPSRWSRPRCRSSTRSTRSTRPPHSYTRENAGTRSLKSSNKSMAPPYRRSRGHRAGSTSSVRRRTREKKDFLDQDFACQDHPANQSTRPQANTSTTAGSASSPPPSSATS